MVFIKFNYPLLGCDLELYSVACGDNFVVKFVYPSDFHVIYISVADTRFIVVKSTEFISYCCCCGLRQVHYGSNIITIDWCRVLLQYIYDVDVLYFNLSLL